MTTIDWRIEGLDFTLCNCDFSCPCQFSARPTHDHCRAAAGFRIDKGYFGDTDLAAARFVGMFAWPGAIHEGHGEAQLILDATLTEPQRTAITALFRGEHTEPGATIFNVFSNTMDTYHEPLVRPIDMTIDVDARIGHIAIPGIVEGIGEPIRNPVTGAGQRARVVLPDGFEYHEAEYGRSTIRTPDARIPLEWTDGHAHFSRVAWTPQGVVHA